MNDYVLEAEIRAREPRAVPAIKGSWPSTPPPGTVALRERGGAVKNSEDPTSPLEAAFKRGGMSAESAAVAARGRARETRAQNLYEAGLAGGLSPAAARVFELGRAGLHEAVVKNVAGLPASCFAWVPDPEDPATWQLQFSRTADDNGVWTPDEDLVRAAVAQVPGIAGFGNALDIPAADLPGVKSILRSAWIACGAALDEMPSELNQEALRRAFRRGGLSERAAAIAASGRERRS